jgi:hypothetical protein
MTAAYDPRADWAVDDAREQRITDLLAAYASNVDAYYAQVRTINQEHAATLGRAHSSFLERNGAITAELRRIAELRRVDAKLTAYARRLRGE